MLHSRHMCAIRMFGVVENGMEQRARYKDVTYDVRHATLPYAQQV